ncbi:unnamed protein product [Arabidopsis arenosa]|uniref:CCHC-type domain-containing protein n=1 Tax=Arabidopsis arenosa TaxID=38785 RepID=A0A8S1ZKT4_ARAAE|nr:unnamed protein product [Arabidopsis arenosa]
MGRHKRSNHRPPPTSKFARVAASISSTASSLPTAKLPASSAAPCDSSVAPSLSSAAQVETKGSVPSPPSALIPVSSVGLPASEISSAGPSLVPSDRSAAPSHSSAAQVETKGSVPSPPSVHVTGSSVGTPASEISSAGPAFASPGTSPVAPLAGSAGSHQLLGSLVEVKGPVAPIKITVSEISSTVVVISPPANSPQPTTSLPSTSVVNPTQVNGTSTTNASLPWAQKFKASLRNLKQMSSPTFLDDGTPVVIAPPSVLLKTAELWKGHLVAQFHGLCPPASRILSDLNPIWGRYGNITVRLISDTASLIFIPSLATREWVVDVGFWQAGNCSCTVYPWSPDGPLQLEELKFAPTWAILRNVPPQLYSLDGISVIASGIGEPLHTEKSRLDPINMGITKVKVVINLESTLPTTVIVRDVQGNTSRVAVEYPRPPPHCTNCGRYGHLLSRCPKPLLKKSPFKKPIHSGLNVVDHPTINLPPDPLPKGANGVTQSVGDSVVVSKPKRRRSRSSKRSRSTPPRIYELPPSGLIQELSVSTLTKGKQKAIVVGAGGCKASIPPVCSTSFSPATTSASSLEKASVPNKDDEDHLECLEFMFPSEASPRVGHLIFESCAFTPLYKFLMRVFCWNIRGLNSQGRQRMVRSWVASNNLLVGCILETHVTEANAPFVLASTFPGWRSDNNYCCSELGRMWIVWDPSVSVLVFKKTDQLILCSVKLPNVCRSFAVAFVYGRSTPTERRLLWQDISFLSSSSPLSYTPWALLGDFNQIASTSEHYSVIPASFPLSGMEDFQSCLRDNDLDDIPSRGVFFTWSNHQQDNPIIRKLDRALANGEWMTDFPHSMAVFDPPGESDHAPCILNLDIQPERSKKCFRYFSFLSTHPTFIDSLTAAWGSLIPVGSSMFSLGEQLKAAKRCCKRLNRIGFSNIQQRTKEALANLESIQQALLSSPSDSLFREEHVARKKWDFYAAALECFYKQKSRIKWLKEGDANTSFFHRAVLAHQAKNLISYLRDENNDKVENVAQIKEMIIAYYTHLFGSESDISQPYSVDRIKSLQPFRCDSDLAAKLIAIPTEEEITATLFSMPKNKAPGPDGFSAEFFWDSWFPG